MQLSTTQKLFITALCFLIAVAGFMLKLPSMFREYDKQLHAAFYFSAAALLNMFFAKKNVLLHLLIFGFLFVMGITIEYAQQYSNRFFAQRIHGRFDPEDVKWNLMGLIAFSVAWVSITSIRYFLKTPVVTSAHTEVIIPQVQKDIKYCPHCGEKL